MLYRTGRVPLAMAVSLTAGTISGLLGLGGGILQVPALNAWCGVPMRAAAATSSVMIGVTAAASAPIYYARGDISPPLAAAAVLGVQGLRAGLWFSGRAKAKWLKLLMAIMLAGVSAFYVQGPAVDQTFDVVAFERLIGRLLLFGIRTSEVCLLTGLVFWLFAPDDPPGGWLLRVGMIALMTVPVLRIALTTVEAIRMKDRLFLLSTLAVAAILAATILYAAVIRARF